jgi:hypothetical protein
MALTKAKFQSLAAKLIDDKFSDFRRQLIFTVTTAGSFNPVTGQMTGGTTTAYNYNAIPQPIDVTEWQGQDVAVTDVMVVYTRIDAFAPSVEQRCTYDGKAMQVRQALYDAADATVKLVLRAL